MIRKLLSLAFIFFIASSFCNAQVPQTLSYQGLLTDASGNPVSGTTAHTVQFNFYTTASGGSAQSRTITGINTFQGLFSAIIGSGASNSANAPLNNLIPTLGSTQYYVGLQVDGGVELSPRAALTSVPYAFTASSLDIGASIAGSQVGSGISAANITTGTLPATQIGAGTIDNSKLSAGIDATKITTGSLNGSLVSTGINAGNITTGSLPASVLGAGTIDNSKLASGIDAAKIVGTLTLTGTGAFTLPSGSSAQRPSSPSPGAMRFNTTEATVEYFNGSNWYFVAPKVAFIKDAKPYGTGGGTGPNANTWTTRALTIIEGDASVVTLNANQFTLAPGEYLIEAVAAVLAMNENKARLYNVSTGATEAVGSNSFSWNNYNAYGASSQIYCKLVVTSTSKYEVQHYFYFGISGANALGPAVPATDAAGQLPEVYTQAKITKLR